MQRKVPERLGQNHEGQLSSTPQALKKPCEVIVNECPKAPKKIKLKVTRKQQPEIVRRKKQVVAETTDEETKGRSPPNDIPIFSISS